MTSAKKDAGTPETIIDPINTVVVSETIAGLADTATAPEMPNGLNEYYVLTPIKHSSELYYPGDLIVLSERAAVELKRIDAIGDFSQYPDPGQN